MKATQLTSSEYSPYYAGYISQVGDQELIAGLKEYYKSSVEFYDAISEDKYHYSYAEGKWNIKEILQHLIDAERVFAYRALRIARGDKTPLPGFAQDDYVATSHAATKTKHELIHEYKTVREATISLFESCNEEMLMALGTASDSPTSVRAIGFIIIGHERHHNNIIKERYL